MLVSTKSIEILTSMAIFIICIVEESNAEYEITIIGGINKNFDGIQAFEYAYKYLNKYKAFGENGTILHNYLMDLYEKAISVCQGKIQPPTDWCIDNITNIFEIEGYEDLNDSVSALNYAFSTLLSTNKMTDVGTKYYEYMLKEILSVYVNSGAEGPKMYCYLHYQIPKYKSKEGQVQPHRIGADVYTDILKDIYKPYLKQMNAIEYKANAVQESKEQVPYSGSNTDVYLQLPPPESAEGLNNNINTTQFSANQDQLNYYGAKGLNPYFNPNESQGSTVNTTQFYHSGNQSEYGAVQDPYSDSNTGIYDPLTSAEGLNNTINYTQLSANQGQPSYYGTGGLDPYYYSNTSHNIPSSYTPYENQSSTVATAQFYHNQNQSAIQNQQQIDNTDSPLPPLPPSYYYSSDQF